MDNCKNKTLKVAALHHFEFHLKKIGNNKWKGVYGKDFEILTILSNKMGFGYELVSPDDKQWGSCDDRGNCSGIIGMVASREADIAISSLSPTEAREKYVDFSPSYFQDEITFVTRKPDTQRVNSVFFAKPFEIQVWISMACFVVIFITMTKILKKFKLLKPKLFLVQNLIAILLRQDVSLKMETQESRTLIILASLLVSAGCAGKIYEGTLTSATSLTSTSGLLDTLEDMADAIENKGFVIGAPQGSSIYYQIMSSDQKYLKVFANSMRKNGFETHQSAKEGLIKVLNEKYAIIEARTALRKVASAEGLNLSKFHFANDYIFIDQNAVAYGKNFRCKDDVNKWLVALAGSDLTTKWEMNGNWLLTKATVTSRPSQKYIDLNDFKLVLIGLIIGYTLALAVLIVELLTHL